jgi:hypothetical protein
LKELELDYNLHLHIVQVSGKRMIAEGTDGLSRADHGEGVMLGNDIRCYIPLHLNPIEGEPKIKSWVEDVTRGLNFQILKPSGWFDDAHNNMGNFVWNVPPAAAEVVVEQLGFARLKRPEAVRMIVVPRLMTGRWIRHLTCGTDGYARLDDKEVWDISSHYELVLIYFCWPYRSENPKFEKRRESLVRIQRVVLEQPVPAECSRRRRHLLRKLLGKARDICPM